jgi:type II secretory pathway pseudopilin PulG
MKSFTFREVLVVTAIILFTASITLYNLNISLRRARDAQRRADIGAISNAVNKYKDDFGFFPPSHDGKMVACKGDNFEEGWKEIRQEVEKGSKFDRDKFFAILSPCEWGEDALRDLTDDEHQPYMSVLHQDPKADKGMSYLYLSNSNRYQIFSFMEGGDEEIGYDGSIVARNLECGVGYICSFGKHRDSPLDRSIEDYERELLERARTGS